MVHPYVSEEVNDAVGGVTTFWDPERKKKD
jgi:hypothetical protein